MKAKLWFEIVGATQEKRPFSNGLFSIQSEGLACNLTAGEYVIRRIATVWYTPCSPTVCTAALRAMFRL